MAAEYNIDDLIINEFYANYRQPVMIDVGAAKPDFLSIGQGFRNCGFKVIGIEPNPLFCELHKQLGNIVYQYACSDYDKDDVDFYVVNSFNAPYWDVNVTYESFSSLGITGKFKDLQDTIQTDTALIKVHVRKLDTILQVHEPDLKKIDVLAIDTEGWEINVLHGFSLEKYQPDVVVMENLFDSPSYRAYMRSRGYKIWKQESLNDVYVRESKISIDE